MNPLHVISFADYYYESNQYFRIFKSIFGLFRFLVIVLIVLNSILLLFKADDILAVQLEDANSNRPNDKIDHGC